MSIKFCIVVRPDTNCYLNEEFKEVWDLNEAKLYDTVECVQSQTNLKKIEWKDYWEVVEIYTLTENTYKKSRDVLAKQSMGVKVLDVILSAPRVDLSELRSTLDSLFFHQNYLTEILGITSSSNLELTRYIQLLTQANKKIHELQQELNLTAANQIDLKNASRQFVSNISTWWQNVGPGYVKDVQIKEGFAQATLSCAILDITDLFSTTAIEEPKQSVAKRLEALGFTIKSNGRDAFVENTAESLNTLTKLVKSQWASANIHKVNVAYDSNLNIMIISEIVIMIYDLNEVLLSPATKVIEQKSNPKVA